MRIRITRDILWLVLNGLILFSFLPYLHTNTLLSQPIFVTFKPIYLYLWGNFILFLTVLSYFLLTIKCWWFLFIYLQFLPISSFFRRRYFVPWRFVHSNILHSLGIGTLLFVHWLYWHYAEVVIMLLLRSCYVTLEYLRR